MSSLTFLQPCSTQSPHSPHSPQSPQPPSCPSGAFPKVLGTATINDCYTEIKQVDVDEGNDRLVAVGLSDIVGLTEKDKNDNKKPIILMMKITKDGSNSQKIIWGFRFEGGVKSSYIGQVAFSSDYTKVVAVSYDIAQISCNEVKQDQAKIMVFDALNGSILNKRYYNQYSSCDELKDFYQRLILAKENHVYMTLRGSIIQSNKNYSRAFNVFKLSLTDGTSSPLSVTGIKIDQNQLFNAAPLGITMGSSDSTLFLLAYDYNQQKFIVSRVSTTATPWKTYNKQLNYNNARMQHNYINYKEYQGSPKGLLLIVGSIVMENSSIKKAISSFEIDGFGKFGTLEQHLILSHENSVDNYVLKGVQMDKENCFFMLLLERNEGKHISFNRFHLAYVNLTSKSVTYFPTLPSFPYSNKMVYSSATFSPLKPGIFYLAASVESQIFKEGIGLSPITFSAKGQQSAIVTNNQTNNCQMINPWISSFNPRDLNEDDFEVVAPSVENLYSNLYVGTSISLKVVNSTDINITDIKSPANAVINIDNQCTVKVKEIPGTYTSVEPVISDFNVQLSGISSCVPLIQVSSPIDLRTSSSDWACPTSTTYNLDLSVTSTPSLSFIANPTYNQTSNFIEVCINSPNSPGIYDLTYRATVRETKQSREVRVLLTGKSSQYIKFDTPLNMFKLDMDAYTQRYLKLPLIVVDQMPQTVELLTYDQPRWVTVQKVIPDQYPTILLNTSSSSSNTFKLVFSQPDPLETTEFIFHVALQYNYTSTAQITSQKYKVKVKVINTDQAPIFEGIPTDKKLLGWILVEVGKVKSFQMPNITDETPKQVEIELGILKKNVQLDWVSTINSSVIVTPTDLKLVGLHTITITLRDAHKYSTYLLEVKVTTPINTGPPLFSPSLSSLDLRIPLGSNFTYELPLPIDPDPRDVTPSVQLISLDPDLKPYVTFTAQTTLTFTLPPSVPLSGKIFQLTFSVSDQSPFGALSSQDTLNLKVYAPQTPSPPSSPPPARVYVEQPPPAMVSSKKPQSKLARPLRVEVKQMTSQGVLTLRYSDKIMNTSVIDETMILFKVWEGFTDKEGVIENKAIVRWNVTRVGDREQEFAIEFSEPGEISNDKVKDTLEIKFLRNETLLRVEDLMGLPINHTITYSIPQQVKQTKSILLMGKAADAASKSLTYALVSNAILQIFLSFSMQLVWGMMNTLQLISYTLKFSLIVPANLFTYFEVINEFLSMKAQFIQKWVDWLMEKVGMAGAEGDENVLKNMETLLIALIAIVILILCTLVIRLFIERVQFIRTIYEALKKKLLWNSLLRFGIQSYLKMTHLALVSSHTLSFSDKSKSINSVSAIAMLTFAAGFPIFTHWFLKTRRTKLQTTEYQLSFNSLYLTLETELRASSIWYTTLFLVRRLILAVTVAFLGSGQGFQVAITEVTGMAMIVYIIRVKPMNRPILNWLDIYNELTFLTTTILMKYFTDYTPDFSTTKQQEKETRENIGWVIIGVTSLYIVINLIFIVHGILHSLWQKLVPLSKKLSARYCPTQKAKKGGAETYKMNRDITNLSQSQIHLHQNQSSFYEQPAGSILDDVQVEDFDGQNVDFTQHNSQPPPASKKKHSKKAKPPKVEKAVHIRDLRSNVLETYKPSEEFKQGDPIAKESRYQEIAKFAGGATTQQTGYTEHLDRLKQFVEKSKRPDQAGFIMQIPQTFAPQPLREPQKSLRDYLDSPAFAQGQDPTVDE